MPKIGDDGSRLSIRASASPEGNVAVFLRLLLPYLVRHRAVSEMAGLTVEVHDGPIVQVIKFVRTYSLLLIPLALLCRFVYYRYASPLRQYPGPLLASGSRVWKVWSTYNGKTETDHIMLHERYGKFPLNTLLAAILTSLVQAQSFASLLTNCRFLRHTPLANY